MVKQREDGYIALLAVLIIGAAAVAISLTDSQRAALIHQQSKQARAIAVGCAQEALQQIHDNNAFTGTNPVSLGQGSCTYTVTNTGGANRTILSTATVGSVVIKIQVYVTIGSSISITSWQEVS
jgi:acyl-CoA synthetase (AMP-forming)/AMP-acid ligase II